MINAKKWRWKNFRLEFYGDENDRYIASRVGLKLSSLKIVR